MTALFRTELVKGTRRTRTAVIVAGLVVLPVVITLAINARGARPDRGDAAAGLFRLARHSGFAVPAAVLAIMSGFLLVITAAMFAGDSVAGDASTGNLRYVLLRPVSRTRLLLAKATVAALLIWATTIVAAVAALAAGVVVFGAHPLTVAAPSVGALLPFSTFTLSTGTLLWRLTVATAYVAFGFTGLLAIGVFFSTLTDTPAGAIGGAVGVYIISEILDGITEFGIVRYGFPTHYLDAWQTMITRNHFSQDMLAGVIVQLAYLAVFGALSVWWFSRKDITS